MTKPCQDDRNSGIYHGLIAEKSIYNRPAGQVDLALCGAALPQVTNTSLDITDGQRKHVEASVYIDTMR